MTFWYNFSNFFYRDLDKAKLNRSANFSTTIWLKWWEMWEKTKEFWLKLSWFNLVQWQIKETRLLMNWFHMAIQCKVNFAIPSVFLLQISSATHTKKQSSSHLQNTLTIVFSRTQNIWKCNLLCKKNGLSRPMGHLTLPKNE